VIGQVDDHDRALLSVEIGNEPGAVRNSVTAWIDTAFDGHLVFPRSLIEQFQLESLAETEAVLADDTKVTLETFVCYLSWFGTVMPLQVIANEGRLPLLGTALLTRRVLHIDYASKQLTLD